MSNQKEKERWQKIQENKKKTCENCSQLFWNDSGNPCCRYDDGTKSHGGYAIHSLTYIKQTHAICFDKYNGKNIKPEIKLPKHPHWGKH